MLSFVANMVLYKCHLRIPITAHYMPFHTQAYPLVCYRNQGNWGFVGQSLKEQVCLD